MLWLWSRNNFMLFCSCELLWKSHSGGHPNVCCSPHHVGVSSIKMCSASSSGSLFRSCNPFPSLWHVRAANNGLDAPSHNFQSICRTSIQYKNYFISLPYLRMTGHNDKRKSIEHCWVLYKYLLESRHQGDYGLVNYEVNNQTETLIHFEDIIWCIMAVDAQCVFHIIWHNFKGHFAIRN